MDKDADDGRWSGIRELDSVILTESRPEEGLEAGDMGWAVMVHADGAGYEIEFVTLAAKTISVVIPNLIKQVFHGRRVSPRTAPAYPELEHLTHGTLTGNSHQAVAVRELLCIRLLLSKPFSAAMMHPLVGILRPL